MALKKDQPEPGQLPHRRRLLSKRASALDQEMEKPACLEELNPITVEIFDLLSRTVLNEDGKQRRLVEFKVGCRYGKFGKTKAYELIAKQRIRAYKMGGKTLIDLDSLDEYHASLPRLESRAS